MDTVHKAMFEFPICCCNKTPRPKVTKEQWFSSLYSSNLQVHHCEEVQAGTEAASHPTFKGKIGEKENQLCYLHACIIDLSLHISEIPFYTCQNS